MHRANARVEQINFARLVTTTALSLVLVVISCVDLSFAQKPKQEIFTSVEEAGKALFLAVQSGDEQALSQILGGGKELVLSNDEVQDKLDRERFAQKYQEMHRFVQEPNGTTVLYIGAENWPFPIPLVSKSSGSYFDAGAGMREILFRRIGENEMTAIEICHDLVLASKQTERKSESDDPLRQYANSLMNALPANAGNSTTNEEDATPFHGYYFRMLSTGRRVSSVAGRKAGGVVFIAYPAEYRSSGVVTFVITQDEVAYEADLGPNTAKIAKAMTDWKPSSKWHVSD